MRSWGWLALAVVAFLAVPFTASAAGALPAAAPLSWSAPAAFDFADNTYSFGPHAVSCPTASFCAGVDYSGNVLTSTNPTGDSSAWTVTRVEGSQNAWVALESISCPSSSFCVAVDQFGNVITSNNPTGGPTAWAVNNVDGANAIFAVSCPSINLCVAGDNNGGNVITSTDPTDGLSATWTVTNVEPGGRTIFGLSCASATLCAAVDNSGNVITSSNPTGGAGAWTETNIDGTK